MATVIGLDIETAKKPNLLPWKDGYYLSCVSIYGDSGAKTWYFTHDEHDDLTDADFAQNFKEIQVYINGADIVAIHNAKFELNNLRYYLDFKNIWCTQIAQYLLNYQDKKGLKLGDVAQHYGLPDKIDKVKQMWDAGYDTREVPTSILSEYCEDDAYKAFYIANRQIPLIRKRGLQKVFDLQMEWTKILSSMESNGMLWDLESSKKILERYSRYNQILDNAIMRKIKPYVDGHEVNLSGDDLSPILYGGVLKRKEKVPVIKTKNVKVKMPYVFTYKNGKKKIKVKYSSHPDTRIIRMVYGDKLYPIKGIGCVPLEKSATKKSTEERPLYKTDKDTLPFIKRQRGSIQDTVIKLLLQKSKIQKVVATFFNEEKNTGLISKIARDKRLHTNYNQTITRTGRLSSSDPNSQNLPRGNTSPIKCCIIPEFDGIMNADISQIELRVPAQLSGDEVMIKEFQDDEDLHSNGCTDVMKLPLNKLNRIYAKILNFRTIYGGTEWGFFKDPKMPDFSIGQWKQILVNYYDKYKGIGKWQRDNIQHVIDGDGTLTIPTGRQFKFKLGWDGKYNEREIKNYPVQGCAGGDLLPLAAVIIDRAMRKRNLRSKMIMTVHDSIVFDYVESEKRTLSDICLNVFRNLPKYIKQYWGIDWVVPIKGDIETGANYGSLKLYAG